MPRSASTLGPVAVDAWSWQPQGTVAISQLRGYMSGAAAGLPAPGVCDVPLQLGASPGEGGPSCGSLLLASVGGAHSPRCGKAGGKVAWLMHEIPWCF